MKEFRNVHQCHVMQREHTPTTWRHPKKSNINWHHGFNLQLRELVPMTGVGVCGYSGERPPHTVIGRVRLPGWYGAKKGKKEWDFLFLSVRIQSTPSIFVHTHFLLPDKSYVVIMLITSKEREGKNKEKGKNNMAQKAFFSSSSSCGSFWWWNTFGADDVQVKRLNWGFYIHKDNP